MSFIILSSLSYLSESMRSIIFGNNVHQKTRRKYRKGIFRKVYLELDLYSACCYYFAHTARFTEHMFYS